MLMLKGGNKVPSGGTVYDDFDNEKLNSLGIASNFHVFAKNAYLNGPYVKSPNKKSRKNGLITCKK